MYREEEQSTYMKQQWRRSGKRKDRMKLNLSPKFVGKTSFGLSQLFHFVKKL
jgi:hypothetical protein